MTTIFQQAAADIEEVWAKVETVAEADVQVLASAAKTLFTTIEPSLLSMLLGLATDAMTDALDPGALATTLLGQAEAAGSALWNSLVPQAKTAAVNAIAAIGALNASVLTGTAGSTAVSAAASTGTASTGS